jgi:hypothetical protein
MANGQDENLEFYYSIRSELLPEMLGQWVLIADQQLIDVFPTQEGALAAAVKQFGTPPPGETAPYLLKEVQDPEPVEVI